MKAPTVILCLFLIGCGTSAPRPYTDPLSSFKSRCDSYGYQRETAAFSDCVRQLDQQRRQQMQDTTCMRLPTNPPSVSCF